MAKKPDDPPADIPAWVMTFSDVITLLMTFFILLLTFATNEPESYGKAQASMFGGSGSSGIAGDFTEQHDSVLMRARTRAGRSTPRGSEMPPMETAPAETAMSTGIAGLENEELRQTSTTYTIRIPWKALIDAENKLTSTGVQQLRMLAFQVHRQGFSLQLIVSDEARLESALVVFRHLVTVGEIPAFEMGVGRNERIPNDSLDIVASKAFSPEK